jgi:hypothetical protein
MSVPPGRYRLTAMAVNFPRLQDTVELRAPAETLRIVMTGGALICDVRITNAGKPENRFPALSSRSRYPLGDQ